MTYQTFILLGFVYTGIAVREAIKDHLDFVCFISFILALSIENKLHLRVNGTRQTG